MRDEGGARHGGGIERHGTIWDGKDYGERVQEVREVVLLVLE